MGDDVLVELQENTSHKSINVHISFSFSGFINLIFNKY